jgi:hypothetical protein
MPSLRSRSAWTARTSSARRPSPSMYPTGDASRSTPSPLYEAVYLVVQPWWLAKSLSVASCHQQCVGLGDQLVCVFRSTIAAATDAFAYTLWSQIEQSGSGGHIFRRTARHAECVPPLVPRGARYELIIRGLIQTRKRRMADVQEDNTQVLDPNGDGVVQPNTGRARERTMPSRSQEAIDRYAKALVDGLPLRRAN